MEEKKIRRHLDERFYRRDTVENGSAVLSAMPEKIYEPETEIIQIVHETQTEQVLPEKKEKKRKIKEHQTSVQQEAYAVPHVGRGMDFISLFFLVGAICVTILACINYLEIQADITKLKRTVSSLETELEKAKLENEAYTLSLESEAPDLNYIYNTAVGVLGMVYPNNNEVRYYESDTESYFRQYGDIPTK